MIVLTGAAGFIGSVILGYLNSLGYDDIVLVDDFKNPNQFKNLIGKDYKFIARSISEIRELDVEAVIHFGANSSTLEKDWSSIYETNVLSTRQWAELARTKNAKMIFASSAAVYGNGRGPLNLYGFSKLTSERELSDCVCLRLFNVYGPNEYHKGRMASTVFHWFNQLKETGELSIFENSEKYYRDFVWVEDIAKIVEFFLSTYVPGVYDLGSGRATSFDTLADQLIMHTGRGKKKEIPMPEDLTSQYQNNTLADLSTLSNIGFDTSLLSDTDNGVETYLKYLKTHSYY
jgi:ADP-L-glycero-D-manno-heptose 6-epimerase